MKYTLQIDENTSFEKAVAALDQGGIGFLALLDEQGRLLGILTDGDIRRAILNRKNDLREVMNSSPRTVDHRLPQRQIVQLLKDIHRKHMPLVDENNIYKGLVALDDLEFNAKPNCVVIMAGGFGRRLGNRCCGSAKRVCSKISSTPFPITDSAGFISVCIINPRS